MKTAKARQAAAEELKRAWLLAGADTVTITTNPLTPRSLYVRATRGQAQVWVDISPREYDLAHWVSESKSGYRFPDGFPNVNPFHRQKATTSVAQVAELLRRL
jgi:hypothetical protein